MHFHIDVLVEHAQTDDPLDEYNLSMLRLAGAMDLGVPTPPPASGKCGLAGGQRGYFTRTIKACATMSVTVIAGPPDYVGLEVRDVGTHP
jgi:hypothetical protein